jgi:hypothetical protein
VARLATLGVSYEEAGVPGALRLVSGRLHPAVAEGLIYVQDQGSQAVAQLAVTPGRLLDACAAPGGKSLLLSDLCGAGAIVVALERAPRRLPALAQLVRGWQASNVRVVRGDAGRPPFATPFDAILLDAPCSGLGTLARNPDLRWRSPAIPSQAAPAPARSAAPWSAPGAASSTRPVRSGGDPPGRRRFRREPGLLWTSSPPAERTPARADRARPCPPSSPSACAVVRWLPRDPASHAFS